MAIHTRIQLIADDLATELKDKKNFGWYLRIAKKYDEQFLRSILSECQEASRKKEIKNKGAYFIGVLQNKLKK